MNILKILNTLNISVKNYSLGDFCFFYDIDYANLSKTFHNNIIYISKEKVDTPTGTFIYNQMYKGVTHHYIIIDGNLDECFNKLHHYFLNEHQTLSKIQPFLTYYLSQYNTGIKEIIDAAASIFNNPVILTNTAYKVLAINDCGTVVDDPVFNVAMKTGYCNAKSISVFENENITLKVLSTSHAILLNTGMAKKIPRILAKIVLDNEVVGYLGILQVKHALSKDDMKLTEMICSLLSSVFEKSNDSLYRINIIYESIIVDLLNQKITNTSILTDRLESSNWKLKKYLRCSVISTNNKFRHIDNISYLIQTLSIKVIDYENMIIIINNYNNNMEWHQQISFIENKLQTLNLKAGVSNEFENLIDLKQYYQKAKKTLDIAITLEAKDTIFYFAAFLPYYLISNMDLQLLKQCDNVYYRRLFEYDQKHDTNYLETLYYYVLYNCNINKASKKLFLHRNTLSHRLERITAIANMDLTNGIVLQNFILYYQMQIYLSKLKNQVEL